MIINLTNKIKINKAEFVMTTFLIFVTSLLISMYIAILITPKYFVGLGTAMVGRYYMETATPILYPIMGYDQGLYLTNMIIFTLLFFSIGFFLQVFSMRNNNFKR